MGRSEPSSASSPKNTRSGAKNTTCPVARSRHIAIARSKCAPSFLRSAGARLTVTLCVGKRNPLFFTALLTRSRDSLTAASGKPTMSQLGSPLLTSASTSTPIPSSPFSAKHFTFASILLFPLFFLLFPFSIAQFFVRFKVKRKKPSPFWQRFLFVWDYLTSLTFAALPVKPLR